MDAYVVSIKSKRRLSGFLEEKLKENNKPTSTTGVDKGEVAIGSMNLGSITLIEGKGYLFFFTIILLFDVSIIRRLSLPLCLQSEV